MKEIIMEAIVVGFIMMAVGTMVGLVVDKSQ